jgi:hypothetical protein
VAFEKLLLEPGEERTVALHILPRQLAVLHGASTEHSIYLDDAYHAFLTRLPVASLNWLAFIV